MALSVGIVWYALTSDLADLRGAYAESAPHRSGQPSAMATEDDREDLLLSCRYGDLEEIQQFVDKFGVASLEAARDENGNTALHMVCANGHDDVLDYLLPMLSSDFLMSVNNAGSTPLHWAALNKHLSVVKKLVQHPSGPGALLINCKNSAGYSPLAEAELSDWEEGAQWLISQMQLEDEEKSENKDEKINDDNNNDISPEDVANIEVEIQDADGGIARMTLSPAKNP